MGEEKNNKENLLIYGVYTKLISSEKHYLNLQAHFKSLAATWLLMSFAAIGILLSTQEVGLPFDHLIGVVFVCIAGIVGFWFFWYEDSILQEKLMNVFFLEAYRLEVKHDWLPKIHHIILYISTRKLFKFKEMFYIGCMYLLLFIMTISLGVFFGQHNLLYLIPIIILMILIGYICAKIILIKGKSVEVNSIKEFLYGEK